MLREKVQNMINLLEGQEINISGTSTKVQNGDLYWDCQTDTKSLDLYAMDEDELIDLSEELSFYVLDYLKKEYVGKEIKLLDLDNQMCQLLCLTDSESIFSYNTREMLDNSFCYQYNENSGFNFEFKIVKDTEDITDIVVKIVNIDDV